MKKKLAFLLALVLLLSVLILPAYAAERRAIICPACGGSAYESREQLVSTTSESVSSCEHYIGMHTHTKKTYNIFVTCDDCGLEWKYTSYISTICPYD